MAIKIKELFSFFVEAKKHIALHIIIVIFLGWIFLLSVLPKGNVFYEIIRLPFWVLKMWSYPVGDYCMSRHAYGRHFRQYLLFFQPKSGVTNKRHVVVYFHGGGWQFGRPEMFRPNAQALVKEGYCVFMPSHRRLPFFHCKHLRADAANALVKVLEIMSLNGLSEKKIILGGVSSGAHLAALLAFDRSILEEKGWSKPPFEALFLLGAPLNLHGMWHSPPLWMLAGRRSGNRFEKASPMSHLQPAEQLPTLLVHGSKDGLVEFKSVEAFYRKMKALDPAELLFEVLRGGIHTDSASWCFPNHPARQILMDWLADRERRQPES